MKKSKDFRAAAIKHFNALKTIEEQVYATAKRIIRDLSNYEGHDNAKLKSRLGSAISNIVQLVEMTGNNPYSKFTALADLVDDEKVSIYPFTHLKRGAVMQVETLYDVALMVHLVTDSGDNTGGTISFEPENG